MSESKIKKHKIVATLKDGTTLKWDNFVDAMLNCWDMGRDKVKHITIDDGEPMEVLDVFR